MIEIDTAASCRRKNRHELLAAFARREINDARAGRCAQKVDEHLIALLLAGGLLDFELQVGSREAGDEDFRVADMKLGDDIAADVGRGGGGEGDRLWIVELSAEAAEAGVVGTQIVAPFADA